MVGARIKAYLTENGIKQTFLAEKSGLTDHRISDICNKDCRIDCIEYFKICKALGVSLERFFDEWEPEKEEEE